MCDEPLREQAGDGSRSPPRSDRGTLEVTTPLCSTEKSPVVTDTGKQQPLGMRATGLVWPAAPRAGVAGTAPRTPVSFPGYRVHSHWF